MNDYLLFIDTEASGLPVNWSRPYSHEGNWPYAVQVSWLIYDKDRTLLKQENHYIKNDGFTITPSAIAIHGITDEFLAQNGKDRADVLRMLAADLLQYQPMVIGHFIKLDYFVLGADFYRSVLANPLTDLPMFCTMVATKFLKWNPMPNYLRLEETYHYLFYKDLPNAHNALNDAQATAECFYELLDRNEINQEYIADQAADFDKYKYPVNKNKGCMVTVALIIVLLIFTLWIL